MLRYSNPYDKDGYKTQKYLHVFSENTDEIIIIFMAFVTILVMTSLPATILPHPYFYANAVYTKAVPLAEGSTTNDPNLKAEVD
jgi:hypothetical protein